MRRQPPTTARTPARDAHRGYSLTEIAIVLGIVGLVLGLSLSTGSMMLDVSKIKGTRERLELAKTALELFWRKYDRYPCPAGLTCSTTAIISFLVVTTT